ncbi:hypothetical protein GE09DRAFT_1217485 [Coniochaeta sp. 2T2.1]|nr:hypothetical protein GE09DRAFT_1217485 [Coniochaeta sp. 2T2.1]
MYTEDAVRLEVFQRLGMIHTCCKVTTGNDDEKRQQVQDEDAELNKQLELIMDAYRNYAQRHGATSEDALDGWWRILDGILVPTINDDSLYNEDEEDEERGSLQVAEYATKLHDRRAAQERELMSRTGYGDLDFKEAIRRHFREYLDNEDETTTAESEMEEHNPPADTQQPSTGSPLFQDQGRQSHARRRNSL